MDTESRYVEGADFYVRLAGDTEPDWVRDYKQSRIEDPDDSLVGTNDDPLRDHHILNEDVPIDGVVCFYYPGRLDDPDESGVWSFSFPFRDYSEDSAPWYAFPDREKGSRHPVWRWENPDRDPKASLTLSPSLGVGDPVTFHCYIRGGEVEWL